MATNSDSTEDITEDERERLVRRLRYLYKNRFTDLDIRNILESVNWDESQANNFILTSNPAEVRTVTGQSEDALTELRTDKSIIDELKNGIKHETRLFACEQCDRYWWRKVPLRKEVSECRRCKQKYDPVPREVEWGWATYRCECGNEFSGSGLKSTSAPCYQCDKSVFPCEIRPPRRRGPKKSYNTHCCDAPDCTGHDPVPIHEVDPDRVYDDGTDNRSPPGTSRANDTGDMSESLDQLNIGRKNDRSGRANDQETLYSRNQQERNNSFPRGGRGRRNRGGLNTCASPQSREGKKKVIYPSDRHISTGSTLATFLTQSDDTSFEPTLPSIPEK